MLLISSMTLKFSTGSTTTCNKAIYLNLNLIQMIVSLNYITYQHQYYFSLISLSIIKLVFYMV